MAPDHDPPIPSDFLRLSNSEPDLTLQLSLGGGGSGAGIMSTPAVALGQVTPMPNVAAAADHKGKAPMMTSFAAAGGRQLTWKKRARELGYNGGQLVMPPHHAAAPGRELMPPPPPRLPRAASDPAHHNNAFRRAVSVINSVIDGRRASYNPTTVMAPPREFITMSRPDIPTAMPIPEGAGNYAEHARHKLIELDAPRGVVNTTAPCSNYMLKPVIRYGGQSSYHQAGSPLKSIMKVAPSSNYMVKPALNIYGKSSQDQEVGGPSSSKKAKHVSFAAMGEDEIERIIKVMPSVITTGGHPNGRKIEGVLFKYLEGKVWIVCVCHGNLLSPEEFVQHAGGSDLTNAMKLIKVVR